MSSLIYYGILDLFGSMMTKALWNGLQNHTCTLCNAVIKLMLLEFKVENSILILTC